MDGEQPTAINGRKPNRYRVEDCGYKTPCWIWLLKTVRGGYAMTWDQGRHVYAHRFYYEQQVGPIPEGLTLDHLCRVRNCVNPEHLEPCTHAENIRRRPSNKLTAEQVREIYAQTQQGLRGMDIARDYGVTPTVVSRIKHGRDPRLR